MAKHHKKKHHHERHHKEERQNNIWMYSAFLLGALLLVSVFTNGFRGNNINTVLDDLNELNTKESSSGVKSAINSAISSLEKAQDTATTTKTKSGGNAKVVIEEFSDFECPFCSRAVPVVNQILETYGDDVELIYKHFPLSSIHPNAQKAAEASECARDQDMFKEYHDILFENQRSLNTANYKTWAAELGLNTAKFNSCLDNGDKISKVQADFSEGQQKGVSGTPTFFINGQKLVGAQPFESFKTVIDSQLSGDAPVAPEPTPQPQPTPTTFKASVDDDPVKGNEDAKVVIVEWSDFECPFCARFYRDTYSQLVENYIDTGKVKLVFRDFPLSFHAQATPSALAAECAHDQDMFWEYHNKLFDNQASLSEANYKTWAAELGLDTAEFNECYDSKKHASDLSKDMSEGQTSGITGTPGFIIGVVQPDGSVVGQKVSGAQPYANFKSVIDAELAKV